MSWLLLAFLALAASASGFQSHELEEQALIQEFDRITDLQHIISELSPSTYGAADIMPLQQYFNIRTWETLRKHANLTQARVFVKQQIKAYQPIDPRKTMAELTNMGSILRLAYSGAKGRKCSTPILSIMGKYQDLVKDSLIITSAYTEAGMKALRYHKYAVMFLSREKYSSSVNFLLKCKTLAERMAILSKEMEDKTGLLNDEALIALESANNEGAQETAAKRELQKQIDEQKRLRELEKERQKNLKEAIKEEKKKEAQNTVLANQKEMHPEGFYIRIWWIEIPIGNTDNLRHNNRVRAEKAKAKKEIELSRKARSEYLRKQRASNLALKNSIESLKNMDTKDDRLSKVIQSLDITVKSMGKIKTAFANARVFWNGLKNHLNELASKAQAQKEFIDLMKKEELLGDDEIKNDFMGQIEHSGYGWVAIATLCLDASETIKIVNEGMDESMRNIPSEAEADQLIQTISAKLMKDLDKYDKVLEDEQKKAINQDKKSPKFLKSSRMSL